MLMGEVLLGSRSILSADIFIYSFRIYNIGVDGSLF